MNEANEERNTKGYTIHMIGNAHIDPVWLWRMEEGRKEVHSTCRSALDLMQETPGFIFSRSSAATYAWLEEDDPEMFEEIRARVREGRWNIVNGWWVQPDCNIPCGESYVRHALYGKRYFLEKFGVEVKVGYNVDSFGHNGMLPQLLKKCGLDTYVFMRPGPHEKDLPPLFWWEAPDGSRVLTCRVPGNYTSGPEEVEEDVRIAYEQIPPNLKDGICFYGVGNHGGGPTRRNIQSILECDADPSYPHVEFSTPERFFKAVLGQCTDFPTVKDDLQHHAPGCYSVVSQVKRLNRRAECLLMTAEKFASLATVLRHQTYPQAEFTKAWQDLLFNQFHDVLAGTSIPSAYDEVNDMLGATLRRAANGLNNALKDIGAGVNTQGDGHPLLVFNPLAWEREDVVEAEVALPQPPQKLRLTDDRGDEVAVQPVALIDATHKGTLVRMAFKARVPALGYRLYRLFADRGATLSDTTVKTSPVSVENEFYRVTFDLSVGCMSSIHDKENDVEILSGRGNLPVVLQDESDTWSHGVSAFRDELGCFTANHSVEVVECGPVRATMRVTSSFGDSKIVQDVMMYPGVRRIDCRMTVDWHEQHRMLKLSMPLKIKDPMATYEIPYGSIVRRSEGIEEPTQRWIDVTGRAEGGSGAEIAYGVSLLNDCKYGCDIKGSELRMTVLRSPIYAFHAPREPVPGAIYRYTDQGEQTLLYAVVPHGGENWKAGIARSGHALNNPLIHTCEGIHAGTLPLAGSFLEVGPHNVVATVLKKAEDSDDLILRLYETAGRDCIAEIRCPLLETSASVPLGHYEIKTLKISFRAEGEFQPAETDMLERTIPS